MFCVVILPLPVIQTLLVGTEQSLYVILSEAKDLGEE
jgi:hypothetical protein